MKVKLSSKKKLFIFTLAVVVFFFFNIIFPLGSMMLIVGPSKDVAWALHPRILKTIGGEIYISFLDHVGYDREGNEFTVINRRGIRNNLCFKGNKINQDLTSVSISLEGGGNTLFIFS